MPQYRKGSAYDPESQAFLDRFRLKNLWPSTGAVTQETQPLTPINLDPEPFHIETDVPRKLDFLDQEHYLFYTVAL